MLRVLRFTSPSCGPCKAMKPNMDAIKQAYGTVIDFVDIDVTKNMEQANKLEVTSVPTLLLFDDAAEIDRVVGYQTYDELEDFVGGYVQPSVLQEQS